MTEKTLVVAMAAALAAGVTQGCSSHCLLGTPTPQAMCRVTGTATLKAPAAFGLGDTLVPGGGNSNCLAADGTCSMQPRVSMGSKSARPPMFVQMVLPLTPPTGSFTLPAGPCADPIDPNCLFVSALINVPATGLAEDQMPSVVSGTIDVQRATITDLDLTFAMELQTASGPISVTGGQLSMAGCHVETVCAE